MHKQKITWTVCGLAFLIWSCQTTNSKNDEAELMKIHESARDFHFQKNAKGMVDGFASDLVMVNRGKISTSSREADSARFQRYFNAVEFKKWDDLNPPTIRFSDDHSLAYMIIDKLVVSDTQDSTGRKMEATTHFAWVSIFRKNAEGKWMLECVASTNEPEILKPQ